MRGATRPALQRGTARTRAARGRPGPSNLLPLPPRREEEWRLGGAEEEDEEEMTMETTHTRQQTSRERIGSKRKERDDLSGEEDGMNEPPAKH
jgi:hypothetical protein